MKNRLLAFLLVLCLLFTNALAEIRFPSGIQEIETEAFMDDQALSVIDFPEGLTRIESKAFSGCGLSHVSFPSSLIYIADDAFDGNQGMIVNADPGDYAYEWAVDHGFTVLQNHPLAPTVEVMLTDWHIVSWAPVPNATGYRLYYSTSSYITKSSKYLSLGAEEVSCNINTIPGTQYYYAICAQYAGSESNLSSVATAKPKEALPAPSQVEILGADSDGNVTLSWAAVSGTSDYRICCSADPEFDPFRPAYIVGGNETVLTLNLVDCFGISTSNTCYLWVAAETPDGPGRVSARTKLNWLDYTVSQMTPPTLQQDCQDGMGSVTLSWNSLGAKYWYQVYGGRTGSTPRLIKTTKDTVCTVGTVSDGQYVYYVRAGLEDSSGYVVYGPMSDALNVTVRRIWFESIRLNEIEQMDGQTCMMTWSALSPIDRYEGERLYPSGEYETRFANHDEWFDFDLPDDEIYTYRVRAYYQLDGVTYYSPWSNTVTHQRAPQNQVAPAAPELTRYPSADGVLLYGDVELSWIPNDDAQSVYVTVEKKNGSDYLPVADYNIEKGTVFNIPSTVFDFIPANGQAQIRVSVGSEGVVRGDPVILNYSMYGKGTILIDGQAAAAAWNRPYRTAASKTFTITASESWTAASTATWLQTVRDGNLLAVSVTDNPTGESRTGTVTVSCEGGSQTITVAQGTVLHAPAFYLSDGTESGDYLGIPLSQNQNSPTPVSYKSFKVNIDKNNAEYVQIKWYFANNPGGAVTDSGTWTSKTYSGSANNIGAVYCLEASARMANNAAVAADDSPVAKYYYILKNVEDFLLLDGQENTTVYARTDNVAKLAASGDVTWQTDVNWITVTEEYRNTPKARKLRMTCLENTTGSNRTGHVTVTCGGKSGVITIIQIPNVPQITSPSLSTNSASPTTISNVYMQLTISGATSLMIDEYLSSGWSSVLTQTVHEAEDSPYVMGINLYDEIGSTSATKFRFGVSDDYGHTTYYYFKYTSSTKHIYLGAKSKPGSGTFMAFDAAAAQTSQSFYMASNNSWTTSSSASWLTSSPSSGSSTTSQSVTVTAQRNTTGVARTATIQFKISGTVYAECRVTQVADDQVVVTYDGLPLSQTNALSNISPSSETSVPLKAYGTSTVTANADVSWITVDSSNRINVAANTGAARTGHVTYTCGTASQTVTLTQLGRLGAVTIKSHTLSTDSSAPTFLPYSDTGLSLSWNRVSGARKYEILLKINNAGSYTRLYVNDTGSSTCTYTIPASYFDPTYTGKYDFRIYAVDERGNVGLSGGLFFFTYSVSGGVMLDGKTTQTWNSVNDLSDSKSYVIASSTGWTAAANASWIHASPASGSTGSTLTVTLDQNTGAQRTGKVTVTSGGGSAVLNITQCAALAAIPEITSPALSLYKSSPAMFAKTDSLTVTWQKEPQVGFCEIDLCEANGHVIQHVSGIKTGTYTFDTSALIPGRLYMIEILRHLNVSRSSNYAADYYFCYTPDSTELTITSSHSSVMDDLTFIGDGSEENAYYDVSSSGTWIATVSDSDWIMLSRRAKITAEYLAEEGESSSDYRQLIGEDGTSFRLCLLANETGASRSGTVTVTTPGTSVTFEVTQSASYTLPAVTSPSISSKPSTAESLPYSDIALTWNKGSGTTGEVTLTLFENSNAGYVQVWKASGLTGTSATVPGSVMQERTSYRLRVETRINDLGESDYRNYYFRTGAANALALNATVDWSQALYGGVVTVRASAYGGAGNYRYDYQLLHNGQIESESGFETVRYYSFTPGGTGTYQVKVIVRDEDKELAEYTSTWEKTDTNVISVAVASQYVANLTAQSQTLDYTVISNGAWTVTEYPYWVELVDETGASGSELEITVGANQGATRVGRINFESSTGIASTLTITQVGSGSASQPGMNPSTPETQDLPPVDYAPVQAVLQSTEIMVGENLVAEVTAYGASAVRLVVDNRAYDEYTLENGQAHVERIIHQSGIRQIQFQAYLNGSWSEISVPQTLIVNEQGQLKLPSLSVNSSGNIGEDITVSIPTVANADTYYLTILLPDSTLPAYKASFTAQELLEQNNLIPISGKYLLQTGEYYADVLVSGKRYSQNENGIYFTLTSRQYDTQILTPHDTDHFVMGDTISVSITQSGGGYAAIAVKGKSGTIYYPDNENNLTTQATFVQTITLPEAGDYEITSYVYATDGKAALNVPQAKSQTIHVTLDGPIINDVQVETRTGNKTWADAAPKINVYIITNSAVDEVEIIEDGQSYPARFVDEIKYVRTFVAELTNAAACLHQIHVIAKDRDLAGSICAETDKSFYVAQKVTDSASYPVYPNQDRITLYLSPCNKRVVTTAVGGALFETLWVTYEADHWYRVRNAEKVEGFVSKDEVSLTLPAASQGKVEIIQPRNGQIIHKGSVLFKLQNGIANATEATVKFRNLDSNKEYTRSLSGMTEGTINIGSFDTGRYKITVVLSSSNSSATVESTPINVTVESGLSALDEEYRMWLNTWYNYAMWFVKPSVYHPQYDAYLMSLDECKKIHDFTTSGTVVYQGSIIPLLNPETVPVFQQANTDQQKMYDIVVLGNMLQEESDRRYVRISNMSPSLQAHLQAGELEERVQANIDLITAGADALSLTINTHSILTNYAEELEEKVASPTMEKVKDIGKEFVDIAVDAAKEMITDAVSEYDSLLLLKAYKREYADILTNVTEENIQYLEDTLFSNTGSSDMDRLEESALVYINAYRDFLTKKDTFPDAAVNALMNYPSVNSLVADKNGNLDYSKLQSLSNHLDQFIWAYLTDAQNWEVFLETILEKCSQEIVKAALKKAGLDLEDTKTKYLIGKLVSFINKDFIYTKDGAIEINYKAFLDKVISTLVESGLTIVSAQALYSYLLDTMLENLDTWGKNHIKICDAKEFEVLFNHEQGTESARLVWAMKSVVEDIIKTAWKLGTDIEKTYESALRLRAQCHGQAAFEANAAYITDNYAYQLKFAARNNLYFLTDSDFETLSIQQLENVRAALITLLHSEEMSLCYLKDMWLLNVNSGSKFTLKKKDGETYMMSGGFELTIDDDIKILVDAAKELSLPSKYQSLVNGDS